MTCHDVRELFSALLDETLTRDERADVYGHLATCADCRRELAAVERTVALIRGATPVRAPAGFVDRVVAAARPTPWYVRAARVVLVPWPVKLPLSAAAILLVGGLAVLMFRGAQEREPATRHEPTPPALTDRVTGERPAQETAPAKSAETTAPAAPPDRAESPRQERLAKRDAAPVETFGSARAPIPRAAAADVVARLAAPERETAERALAALAARLAGAQTGRHLVDDALVVELAIPRARYDDFTREAARFGDYRTQSEPSTLPDPVRIAVHLRS